MTTSQALYGKTWQAAAVAHALAEYPARREACGLIVERAGAQIYMPCVNRSPAARDRFEIAPEDYLSAEAGGEIVAVFHSHPDYSANPSAADRAACEASGLPWHVLGLPDQVWGYCEPAGFELPYEGRTFVHGLVDCYTIIRDWYRRERQIVLPDFERRDDWWKRGEDLYVENFARAGFHSISHAQAQPGDVLLMNVAATVANHGAILLDGSLILHHMHFRLSEITVYGGYYRDHTRYILRHKDA